MRRYLLAVILLTISFAIYAEEDTHYDRINLSVEANEEVENDTLVATLYAREEGTNAEQIARIVNEKIASAISVAKKRPDIKVQTLDYSTQPIYGKGTFSGAPKLSGWRVQQSIRLKSKNAAELSDLVGELQETLAVSNIGYTVSPEQRELAQEKLIKAAISNFKQRANLVSQEMAGDGYRLVSMSINTSGVSPRPYAMRGLAEGSTLIKAPSPAMEAGTQRMSVNINGAIELKR